MAKNEEPQSGPTGNQDDSKRGRGLPRGGRKSQPGTAPSGTEKSRRKIGPDDFEGFGVGGRNKK
jgi:hypothetical protein